MKKFIVYIFIAAFVFFGLITAYNFSSRKSLTVQYNNAKNIAIYKGVGSEKNLKPVITISSSGQVIKLRGGPYAVKYEGLTGYASGIKIIDVVASNQKVLITASLSEASLNKILDAELPGITKSLAKYPNIKSYTLSRGKLYNNGGWYGSTLIYAGSSQNNNDTLRVILHKEGGVWIIMTDPPSITLSSYNYPKIPIEILNDVNDMPVPVIQKPAGGARLRQ